MTKRSAKNTVCLWYNDDAEEAAHFCTKIFPDPAVAERAFDAMDDGDEQNQHRRN
jgi:predicted 3-demethylubiquinone-9 3-methyltransferase (glyoxalase superfamily)